MAQWVTLKKEMMNQLFITIISFILAANMQVRSASVQFKGKIKISFQHGCVTTRVCVDGCMRVKVLCALEDVKLQGQADGTIGLFIDIVCVESHHNSQ